MFKYQTNVCFGREHDPYVLSLNEGSLKEFFFLTLDLF